MGWWGFGVMEGDGPMDVQCMVEKTLLGRFAGDKEGETYEGDLQRVNDLLKDPANVAKCWKQVDKKDVTDVQAFGHIVMVAGGSIADFEQQLLAAIDNDDSDCWTKPKLRREAMKKFRQQVVSYDSAPIEDDTMGLLDTIAVEMSTSKGLINKM